jgi:hypothetical protein
MLPYCQQFCKIFPASSPAVWQRAWAAWCTLSPASLAHIRRSLKAASRTPRRLSTPLLYVTRTHPPTSRSAARAWWTPRSVNLLNEHARTQHHPPHALALDAGYLHAPECSAAVVLEARCVRHAFWCTYWRRPSYLLETPLVPTGDKL